MPNLFPDTRPIRERLAHYPWVMAALGGKEAAKLHYESWKIRSSSGKPMPMEDKEAQDGTETVRTT